jgi:hypothetical protein
MPPEAAAPPAEPQLKSERETVAQSMGKWMQGLRDAMPNPSLGGAAAIDEPPAREIEDPEPPAAPAAPAVPAMAPAAPAPAAPPAEPIEERLPRSAKEWKTFTSARKLKESEYEKTITARDQTIKDLEAKIGGQTLPPEIQTQLDSLKKENDEYSKQLRLVAVTSHPRFKSHFESRINSTLANLKSCVPADQLENVSRLIQSPDGEAKEQALEAMMSGMTTLQQGRLVGVINSLGAIQAERDGEITRARQDYDQMMSQAKTEREQKATAFNKRLGDTVKAMQDSTTGRPEYQLRPGETEWNATVTKRLEAGRALITGSLPPDVMFKAAFDAAAYNDVLTSYKAALGELDKVKKQLTAMTAANPRVEGQRRSEGPGASPGTATLHKDAKAADFTKQWVENFGKTLRGE